MIRQKDKVTPRKRFKLRLTSFVTIAIILFVIGIEEWLQESATAPNPPASSEELLSAAKSMRQKPYDALTTDKESLIVLGKRFFFDPRFSDNQKIACATCHDPQKSFTDGRRVAVGMSETAMNAPTLINVRNGRWFFHNGRADSLEMQAMGPMENPKEHGFTRVKVLSVIHDYYSKEYEALFGKLPLISALVSSTPRTKPVYVSDAVAAYALGTLGSSDYLSNVLRRATSRSIQPVNVLKEDSSGTATAESDFDRASPEIQDEVNLVFANFSKAVAAFERTIRTDDAPFDRFADRYAATLGKIEESVVPGFGEKEFRGFKIFVGEGKCALCHQGSDFTDHQFHNIGLPALNNEEIDLGRAQGVLIAQNSIFSCRGKYFSAINSTSEACAESEFAETENSELIGAFKTPTLRNLRDTAPYMHDGRFPNLRGVLIHYNLLPGKPAVGHTEESLRPLSLNDEQLADLEAFLMSLSSAVISQ